MLENKLVHIWGVLKLNFKILLPIGIISTLGSSVTIRNYNDAERMLLITSSLELQLSQYPHMIIIFEFPASFPQAKSMGKPEELEVTIM